MGRNTGEGGSCSDQNIVTNIVNYLKYVEIRWADNPNYLKVNNKPVVDVYEPQGPKSDVCAPATNYAAANAQLGNSFYIMMKSFNGAQSCPEQPDSWYDYGPDHAELE